MEPYVDGFYKDMSASFNAAVEDIQVWARHGDDCVVGIYFSRGDSGGEIGMHYDLARDLVKQLEIAISQAEFVEMGVWPQSAAESS